MNIGYFSRLPYDKKTYEEKVVQSTTPLQHMTSDYQIYNKDRCMPEVGRNMAYMGHGVSTTNQTRAAEAQDLVDFESQLTNRTIKGKRDLVNPMDVTQYKLYDAEMCKPQVMYSRFSHPTNNYKSVAIDRFYNTIHDPQENIFYDFSINSRLEATDNYKMEVPELWNQDEVFPTETQQEVVDTKPVSIVKDM